MKFCTSRLAITGLAGALVLVAASCSSSATSAGPPSTVAAAAAASTTSQQATTTTPALTTTATTALATTIPTTAPTTVATTVASTTLAPTTAVPTDAPTVAPTEPPTEPPTDAPTVPPTLAPNADIPVAPLAAPLTGVGRKSGAATAAIQQRLTDLGFWAGDIDGRYGLATTQAVMAFQKYAGLSPSGSADGATAAALTAATIRAKSSSTDLDVVEIDKTKQLLFIVHGGMTQWVLNTSTGSGKTYTAQDQNTPGSTITGTAITYSGNFKINRERPDGWWVGDLGQIYRPKYFNGGEAIHGLGSVPNYPASHGCVRVSVPAMDFIWAANLIPLRMHVWVH